MKLNKNFVQISLTALITSAVFIIPMANSNSGMFSPGPVASERITTWQWALDRQLEYLRDKPLRVQYPNQNNELTRDDLKGFIFKATDLQEILNTNKSGETPDEVYFFLGQDKEFPDSFLHGLFRMSGNMRIIAVGLKDKNPLIGVDNLGQMSVFDKADPCPPNCPK